MPNVAVIPRFSTECDHLLHRVNLIGAHDHQLVFGFIDDHILRDDLSDVAGVEKVFRKIFEVRDAFVLFGRPEEGVVVVQLAIAIGGVFGVDTVADNEELDELKELFIGLDFISIYLVKGVFEFVPTPL